MTSHAGLMVIFAACVSIVFATLLRDERHQRIRLGARIFGGLVAGAYVLGWIMFGLLG
jgi:hypothetical protein